MAGVYFGKKKRLDHRLPPWPEGAVYPTQICTKWNLSDLPLNSRLWQEELDPPTPVSLDQDDGEMLFGPDSIGRVTTSADGCNVDCFVITERQFRTGAIVECEVLGLMEQIEDGQADHNVLARLEGEDASVSQTAQAELTEFVQHVFDHVEGKQIRVGRFLGPEEAEAHILAHLDSA